MKYVLIRLLKLVAIVFLLFSDFDIYSFGFSCQKGSFPVVEKFLKYFQKSGIWESCTAFKFCGYFSMVKVLFSAQITFCL